MKPVTVGRYKPQTIVSPDNPRFDEITDQICIADQGHTWRGWVETEDWIIYERDDGLLYVFSGRSETGAVKAPAVIVEPAA